MAKLIVPSAHVRVGPAVDEEKKNLDVRRPPPRPFLVPEFQREDAQRIYPGGGSLSEQIPRPRGSSVGDRNMKFALKTAPSRSAKNPSTGPNV